MMRHYAGVDLGATNIKAIVGTHEAAVVGEDARATPPGPSGIDVTEAVLEAVRRACADAGIDPADLTATGIGSFGPLDLAEGMVVTPANLPDSVDRIPLVGPMETLIASDRVYLHNDTTAAVIGERFHSARNPDDMAYLTFSTGIGAGIAVDGHVLNGWDGNAGEVGHFVVDPEGRMTCGCGRDGHWEAYASGTGIPQYARYLDQHLEDCPTDLALEDEDFSAIDVFEAYESDPLADETVDRVARWNAIGLTNVVNAYAPIVVAVGGPVALENESAVIDPLRDALDELVFANVPEVRPTTFGEDIVVRGALASAMTDGTGDRTRLRR